MTREQIEDKVKAISYILQEGLISPEMREEAQHDLDGAKSLLASITSTAGKAKETVTVDIKDAFDSMTEDMNAPVIHPLTNPRSPHYVMVDGVEAIERMEQMYDIEELMNWAMISAMKYRLRLLHKDDIKKEASKIAGFEAYYRYLKEGEIC